MFDLKRISALKRLITIKNEISSRVRGLPDAGCRPDGSQYQGIMGRINEAFLFGNEVYNAEWRASISPALIPFDSSNGSPFFQEPFPSAVKAAKHILSQPKISQYAFASGDLQCRKQVAEYLNSIGFKSDSADGSVQDNQIIFFNSTTEAFTSLMNVICTEGDVVLFTAPTYGLLAYMPERVGAVSRFLPLRECDGWQINPMDLEEMIRGINLELVDHASKSSSICPRVTAFVHINPNNPTGLVSSEENLDLLREIDAVCRRNGVFLIDDIIYRDLCYDIQKQAMPIATIEVSFSNTITLLGTSKSYGLAAARAGAVVANEAIIRGLRNEIFQRMDSTSLHVSYLLAGAFNITTERKKDYLEYFPSILDFYCKNWLLLKTLVCGQSAGAEKISPMVIAAVYDEFQEDTDSIMLHGIDSLSIAGNIEPESGFFALVDFTPLLGSRHRGSRVVLDSERAILHYFYRYANVKLLTSSSFAWPNPTQIVARMTYAFSQKDLIRMMRQIQMAIKQLER